MRRHVRSWRKQTLHRHRNMCEEGQSIAALDAEIDALQRQALALGAEPTADVPAWVLLGVKIDQCPHSAEGDIRALNEGAGFGPIAVIGITGFAGPCQMFSRAAR
jgi:hypothetical protein